MAASTPDSVFDGGFESGAFGPRVTHGKPRNGGPDWLRLGLLSLAVVVLLAVVTTATYAGLVYNELRQLQAATVDIKADSAQTFAAHSEAEQALEVPEVEPVEDRTNILVVGSDSREGLSEEQLRRIGTEETPDELTDTIMLVQIDPETDAAAILSFPRDLLVERCDGSIGKINGAYAIGEAQREGAGARCLVNTVTALTRIPIDHYVRVDFAGFVKAVDALGGVTFYLEEPIEERYSGLDVPSGCVEFDGVQALQFVRARRIDDDFGRMARQQRFAREMVDKATSVGTLVNPVRAASLIGSVSDVVETDTEFGPREMADLVTSLQDLSSGKVEARTVPAVPGWRGEVSVVRAVKDEAEDLYRAFRRGDLLPDGAADGGGSDELGPENLIPILVRNGTNTEGLAADTAEVLEELGFRVADTDTAENYGFDSSLVLYPPDREDHAEVLAAELGGIPINAGNSEGDHLTLILGQSFDPEEFVPEPVATEPLFASESPGPSESPSPSESPRRSETADLYASESESDDASPSPEPSETFAGAELSPVEC